MPTIFETIIKENNNEQVYNYLIGNRSLPVDIRNKASQTGLMIACAFKAEETAEEIIEKNPDLNARDTLGWTALHHATKSGSWECVKLLIKNKAEIDATTDKNETAIFLATKQNHFDIVEFLAEKNCHLQTIALIQKPVKYPFRTEKEEYSTALEIAAENNFVEIAKCLLFHLARKKELHKEQLNVVLLKATKKDHTKIAHKLLINGADVKYLAGKLSLRFYLKLF
jgi:ankyrin repeat protein